MQTRRRMMQTGVAAVAAPSIVRAQALAGTVTLVSYPGTFHDSYQDTVVRPFMQAHPGVKVTFAPVSGSAAILGQIRAQKADPQVDVAIMDVTTSTIGNAEGLFQKLDPRDVPAMAELVPEARAAGGEYGPAVTFDHFVIVADSGVKPIAGVADLWRGDLNGSLAITAPPNILGLALTAIVEKLEGGDYRRSIDAAVRKLRTLAPSVSTFDPNPDGVALVLNGVAKVATGWNARAQLYANDAKGRLVTILPAEGSVLQINTINLVTGTKNRAAALAFIDYALSTKAQKAFTERMYYAPTNARAEVAPDALARTATAPEVRARMVPIDWDYLLQVRDQWNNRWRREIITSAR